MKGSKLTSQLAPTPRERRAAMLDAITVICRAPCTGRGCNRSRLLSLTTAQSAPATAALAAGTNCHTITVSVNLNRKGYIVSIVTAESNGPCYMPPRCELGGMRPSDKNFRENLRKAIEIAGINESELARHLQCAPITVNRWVRGPNEPSFRDLDRIARYFKKSVFDFFLDPTDQRTTGVDLDTAIGIVEAHARAGAKVLKSEEESGE